MRIAWVQKCIRGSVPVTVQKNKLFHFQTAARHFRWENKSFAFAFSFWKVLWPRPCSYTLQPLPLPWAHSVARAGGDGDHEPSKHPPPGPHRGLWGFCSHSHVQQAVPRLQAGCFGDWSGKGRIATHHLKSFWNMQCANWTDNPFKPCSPSPEFP